MGGLDATFTLVAGAVFPSLWLSPQAGARCAAYARIR